MTNIRYANTEITNSSLTLPRSVLLVLHRAVPQPEVHVVHLLHHLWNVHHKVDKNSIYSDYMIMIMAIDKDEDDDHPQPGLHKLWYVLIT